MDRFEWSKPSLLNYEKSLANQQCVRIYDGENQTNFDDGNLYLTTHRLLWSDTKDKDCCIALPLSLIIYTEDVPATFTKSAKIGVHLDAAPANKPAGPESFSCYCHVKFSFRKGGASEFGEKLKDTLSKKTWNNNYVGPGKVEKKTRAGISGIEKQIQAKKQQTDQNISKAFEDLKNLMDMAKDMVSLSKSISTKIREKQGDITEDETIRFKSYLLSLGIDDPVTRDTHGSGNAYFCELAKQLSDTMEKPIKEAGGIMALTDIYCRVNRARGLELLSPEDLISACSCMNNLGLPLSYKIFDSGVMVLQLRSHNEAAVVKETCLMIEENDSLTATQLSTLVGIPVILSKERLLAAEKAGQACRDDSIEGLKFFPNLFRWKS